MPLDMRGKSYLLCYYIGFEASPVEKKFDVKKTASHLPDVAVGLHMMSATSL